MTLVRCAADQQAQAEKKRVEQEKLDRHIEEVRQAVREGKAGPAFTRLFGGEVGEPKKSPSP